MHEAGLLGALDAWLVSLDGEHFIETLPLVRRTFATFARAERGAIANALARDSRAPDSGDATNAAIDWVRARLVLPALREIFGHAAPTT